MPEVAPAYLSDTEAATGAPWRLPAVRFLHRSRERGNDVDTGARGRAGVRPAAARRPRRCRLAPVAPVHLVLDERLARSFKASVPNRAGFARVSLEKRLRLRHA